MGNSHANFSCNQSRAYTKLDTIFVNYVRTTIEGTAPNAPEDTIKPVNWFQGLTAGFLEEINDDTDTLEAYITIGAKRMPLFAETKLNQHYFRLLQATGKNASDVHSLSVPIHTFKRNQFCHGFDLEKLPPGTLAALRVKTLGRVTC